LGDLKVVRREKKQSSGGRLDVLLASPDDNSMYEVEVMLGATDESHIIRTIEYWDLERRRWPERSHTPVLVAERINRRFFNVIHLLSLTIPIVAIQANIHESGGERTLTFTTILDKYEEPEIEGLNESSGLNAKSGETYWQTKSPATLVVVQSLRKAMPTDCPKVTIYYKKRYVSIMYKEYYVFRISPKDQKFLIEFWLDKGAKAAVKILETKGLSFDRKKETEEVRFDLKVDNAFIGRNSGMFSQLAKLEVEEIDL
jgi:hypothetical protein